MQEQDETNGMDEQAAAASARWRASEASRSYLGSVLELARLLGVEVSSTSDDTRAARDVWGGVSGLLREQRSLSENFFAPLIAAAVYEPDPSFSRWYVEPALKAYGRRRVRSALLEYLESGSNHERAGAARAWYYTQSSLQGRRVDTQAIEGRDEISFGISDDLSTEWRDAALREFVRNDDLTVRHYLLTYLPLGSPDMFAPELRDMVGIARGIADAMPR